MAWIGNREDSAVPFDSFDDLPIEAQIIDEAMRQLGSDFERWAESRKVGGPHRCMRGALNLARKALNVTGDRTDSLIQFAVLLAGEKLMLGRPGEIERLREVFFIARREALDRRWPQRFFDLVLSKL
jgi:hypothetical protein